MSATQKIDRAAITQVLKLWQIEFVDFTPVQRNLFLRWNGPFVSGLEMRLDAGHNMYHIRVFIYAFLHEDSVCLFYEGSKDFHYSFARHGIGPIYLGIPEPFAEFCARLRYESIAMKSLTLEAIERFVCERQVRWGHVTLMCMAFIVYLRSGREAAETWLEERRWAFDTFNAPTQALLGGRYEVWRDRLLPHFSAESIRRKQQAFFAERKRTRMIDHGVVGCEAARVP